MELVETADGCPINNDFEQIDHKTCVSICDAIGERLQQNLRPETELSRVCASSSMNCAAATTNCIERPDVG